MVSLSDSDAYYDDNRLLTQHQAVLTVIQGILGNPKLNEFNWLDLACGKGQIITHLDKNINPNSRAKIRYFGYDINVDFTRIAEKTAQTLNLKSVSTEIGEFSGFSLKYPGELRFDFISLTNTVHEINPHNLSSLLYESFQRLSPEGCLFIYDMERISPPELGAIPWSVSEIGEILSSFFGALKIENYEPDIGQWKHKNCDGWNVQVRRDYFALSDEDLIEMKDHSIQSVENKISEVLSRKIEICKSSLESLTKYGAENEKEKDEKEVLLYLFWALSRAMEVVK